MSYQRQKFENGKILTAENLISLETGIIDAENLFSTISKKQAQNGLRVAIIGDSISTHPQKNAPEIIIQPEDVGVALSSFISHYDIGKTVSLNGSDSEYTISAEDVGNELDFVPSQNDIGKTFGTPLNYNSITAVWWQVAADALCFEPIAATWSGSSITSHTAGGSEKKTSYAWHDHTIRTLGVRIPGSMNRIPPDVVLIYRGTNDLSHSKSVVLTEGYFDDVNWEYPETDKLENGKYGFKEGLSLTIKKIREAYPRAIIVLCTCNVFKRSNCITFPTDNGNFSIPQMNNAIRETADFFGCHVIDLDKCGITFENCYSSGYITDSSDVPTHPNGRGHALMGNQAICDLLNKVHIYDITPIVDIYEDELNKSPYLAEYTLVSGTGVPGANDAYFSYIAYPVEPNAKYKIPYGRNYGIYDITDTVIACGGGGGKSDFTVTTPESASYISICWKYDDLEPTEVEITKL